ncbi:pilus assembly protein CpaE [Shewanella sp. Choline-02u-19]|uniref:AAA family ATPase n=1 Tax=unclassified Shewanella TaxID=196818 RepID=UPI000C346034|nr:MULTISPECIES: pilus assembly protein CpaE [unclassified Shewanella]PKH62886.1 pilus assembly protein CpaE [Shewanella sp. Bg11-22]PKI27609.1 pilus assembly protein CpaE [Shewanella sp. Choline-02u-19]
MDKPLELYVPDNSQNPESSLHMSLPFPVQAIVASNGNEPLEWMTHHFAKYDNFKWCETSYLEAFIGKEQVEFNLILLVLPNDESEAVKALTYASNFNTDIIILGLDTPQKILRLAFQYKVSDFIPFGASKEELFSSLEKVSLKLIEQADLAPVIAVINGKAGSGASFIAASLADVVSQRAQGSVALIDTDLHHGTLAHMFGFEPKYSLCDVLGSLEELDEVALKSTMVIKGNLNLLASKPFELLNTNNDLDLSRNKELIWKCRHFYNQVVLDFSRGPEYWNGDMLNDANILVVTQQNIMHLRQTKDLILQLTSNMGVAHERISIIVNRYDKNSNIKLSDIKEAIGVTSVFTIINDYKLSSECVELGKPITEIAKKQQMFLDMKLIANNFMPEVNSKPSKKAGFWKRLLGT